MEAGTSNDVAESIARARLEDVKGALVGPAAGTFVRLAVFDHEWKGTPDRAPLVILSFKDWQQDLIIERPTLSEAPEAPDDNSRIADAFEACQDLLFLNSPVEGLEFVGKLFGQLLPSEAYAAYLYDINANVFRCACALGDNADDRRGHSIHSGSGIFAAASDLVGAATVIDAPGEDLRFDAAIDGHPGLPIRNLLYMPISRQGQLYGVVQLHNREHAPGFSRADQDLAIYVGDQLAEFLYQIKVRRTSQG